MPRNSKNKPRTTYPHGLSYDIGQPCVAFTELNLHRGEEAEKYIVSEIERMISEKKPVLRTILAMHDESPIKQFAIRYLNEREIRAVSKKPWRLMVLPGTAWMTVDCNGNPVAPGHHVVKTDVLGAKTAVDRSGYATVRVGPASNGWTGRERDQRQIEGLPLYEVVDVGPEPTAVTLHAAIVALQEAGFKVAPLRKAHKTGLIAHPWVLVEAP